MKKLQYPISVANDDSFSGISYCGSVKTMCVHLKVH